MTGLYHDYREEFIRFAHRYSDNDTLLEDTFQDALIAVYENAVAGKLDELRSSLKTYLFSTGKFMLFKHFRDAKKEILSEKDYVFDREEQAVMIDVIEDGGPDEHQRLLAAQFEKLGEKCRDILELFYLDGLTLDEITEVQGYDSKNVAKSQKSRCLKTLRDLIHKNNG